MLNAFFFFLFVNQAVGVSSLTGDGMKEFLEAVDSKREEYEKYVRFSWISPSRLYILNLFPLTFVRDYLPELERIQKAKASKLASAKEDNVRRMMADLSVDRARNPGAFTNDQWDPSATSMGENEGDDDVDVEVDDPDLVDRCTHMPFTFRLK